MTKLDRYKLASNLSITAGIFFLLFAGLYHQHYYSIDRIKSFNGTLRSYSFEDWYLFGAGRQHHYLINLNESSIPFQIDAELLGNFNMQLFEKIIKQNDSLSLEYFYLPRLIFPERNVLVSIEGHQLYFLWKEKSLQVLSDGDNLALVFSIIFIAAGILLRWIVSTSTVRNKITD